jgi:prepilin-type N-terminal cleavage/methylation domain-containing protein
MVSAAPHRGPTRAGARPVQGFTLLEVLAAVAILAVWFILIAGTAMQGLRAEGISRRRLEAAMIADRAMADLQTASVDGIAPPLTDEVTEQDDYTISVVVSAVAEPGGRTPAPAASDPTAQEGEAPALLDLLAAEMPTRLADLRRLDVRVAWLEGGLEMAVERTSFAFDVTNAQQAYEEAGLPAADAGGAPPVDEEAGLPPEAPEEEAQ